MSTLNGLPEKWRGDAATLARYGDTRGAELLRQAAADLEATLEEAADEALSLEEAVRESGYSERRLRELIADGSVPNAGRKGKPRIRRCDLPRKARKAVSGYDAEADAHSLLMRARR
jgi:hypothetical protein